MIHYIKSIFRLLFSQVNLFIFIFYFFFVTPPLIKFLGDFNSPEFEHFKNLTREYRLTQYRHTNNEEIKLYLNLTLVQTILILVAFY